MRWIIVVLLVALAGPAAAQQPAQWVRLSLSDGRFVDGYITGGDAAAYFVQTSYGYFSIQRTNVVAVTPMGAPAPASAPPAQYTPPPAQHVQPAYAPPAYAPPPSGGYQPMPAPAYAPPAENKARNEMGRAAGVFYFGLSYGVTVLAASAKVDDDKSAKAGYIPVVGPMLWAFADDEDDAGEDGWDWLAVGGTLVQGVGAWLIITGGEKSSSKNAISVRPVTTRQYSGLAVGGSF